MKLTSSRWKAIFAGLMIILLMGSLSSLASTKKKKEKKPPSKLKLGPVYINPFFEITKLGYDGNIYLSRTTITSDFRATPAFGATFYLRLGTGGEASFTARGDYQWFHRLSSLNYLNRTFSANFFQPFTHFSLYLSNTYQNLRDQIGWEINVLTKHTVNQAEVGVNLREEKKTSFGIKLWDKRIKYDSQVMIDEIPLANMLDQEEYGGSFTIYRRVLPKTKIFSKLRVNRYQFKHPESPLDSRSYQVLFGVNFDKTALIGGTAEIGYEILSFFSAEVPDFRGIIGSSSLSYHLGDALAFSVNYARRLSYSYLFNYYLLQEYGGGVLYYPLPWLGIDLRGNHITLSYQTDGASGYGERRNNVRWYSLGTKLRFSETGTAEFGLGYQYRLWYDGYRFSGYYLFNTLSFRF